MKGINEKIDHHAKQEKRKTLITLVIGLVITVPALSFILLANMGTTSQITGVVVRLVGLPTDEGQDLYLLVKLRKGEEIRSYISNTSFFKKGKEVKIERQEPLLFGKPAYRFRGYVDDDT